MKQRYFPIAGQPGISRLHDCVGEVSFSDLFDVESVPQALAALDELKRQLKALPPHNEFHINSTEDGIWGYECYVPDKDGKTWDAAAFMNRRSGGSSMGF